MDFRWRKNSRVQEKWPFTTRTSIDQVQARLLNLLDITFHLNIHWIDNDGFLGGFIPQQVGIGGRFLVKELLEAHAATFFLHIGAATTTHAAVVVVVACTDGCCKMTCQKSIRARTSSRNNLGQNKCVVAVAVAE